MTSKMFLGVVGSYSVGLNVPGSDVDIAVIGCLTRNTVKPGNFDIHSVSTDTFLKNILCEKECGHLLCSWIQWLYPYYFCQTFRLKDCFAGIRDTVVKALAPSLYQSFMLSARELQTVRIKNAEGIREKNTARSILRYSTVANYAEGMPFAQAHRPEGELHDFLIGVRLGQVPLDEAAARCELERLRAEKAAGFFRKAVHTEVLREFEKVIREESEKEGR